MQIKTISSAGYNFWAESISTIVPIGEPVAFGEEIRIDMKAQVDIIPSARIVNTYPVPRNL